MTVCRCLFHKHTLIAPVAPGPPQQSLRKLSGLPYHLARPETLPGTATLSPNRPGHALNFTSGPLPHPRNDPAFPAHTFPSLRPGPPTPTSSAGRRCPGALRAPRRRASLSVASPSQPRLHTKLRLTARPVPGAATSARPGPRAAEPPLLRVPGRHLGRGPSPSPPRLSAPPRAAPPRLARAAVSGAAGPSAAAAAAATAAAATAATAAAAAIRDNQGCLEDPDTGFSCSRIRIPCAVESGAGECARKPGTWMYELSPGSLNAR
ncbi:uncharacterized protein LOC127689714 [Apodemus sylvaticus]|uniref:uncharacterized protein LOC127689714 n=1 Tax=Apodemus sylvaticus TaxID=10129 RepID=UPI002243DCA0|nr:uncharacterized protein LOC127689714 [Apodemus sylvaticus]